MLKAVIHTITGLGAIAALAASPPVQAAPDIRIDEIPVSGPKDGLCNMHAVDQVNNPDHGKVLWFIEALGRRIGRLDLATGEVTKFGLPKVTPVGYTTHSMKIIPGTDADQGPCDLVMAPDGNLWFNDQASNSVGFIQTTAPYKITEIALPTPKSFPMAMQMGADGKIYVDQTAVDKIAQVDPVSHRIVEFAVPDAGGGPIGGAGSKKDNAHWIIMMNSGKIVRFDYATHKMESFDIPTPNAAPFVIRAYDDGLWFTKFGANALGHFDPATKTFTDIPVPSANGAPIGIIAGADGDLYTDLSGVDKIARIDRATKRVIAEYPLPTKGVWADEMKQGPDGAIWSTGFFSGKLIRLWLSSFGQDPGFPQGSK